MAGTNTVSLYWPRPTEFVDYQTDQRFPGEGVYEIPAEWEGLYRQRGWEDPPEDHDGETEQPTSAINRNLDTPSRDQLEGASSPDEVEAEGGENADDSGEDGGEDTGN